jgi:Pectate lyase superfamily protein
MGIPYEKIVAEDLDRGYGTVPVTMPAGGQATGNQIGLHTFNGWLNVKDFGAVGDSIADDTDAITAALAAAATDLYLGGVVFFPPGRYYTATGITVTALNGISVVGDRAALIVTSDVIPWTWSGCLNWQWHGLDLRTAVNTTGPAIKITNGSHHYRAVDLRIASAPGTSGKFLYGVLNDGAFIGEWERPSISSTAVDSIDMWFKDASGGSYPPNAIRIHAPDLGSGLTGIQIENSDGMEIVGGVIENDRYTKAIYIKNSKRVLVQRVHIETPLTTTPDIYIESSTNCVIDTLTATHLTVLRSALQTQIRDAYLFVLDIDVNSLDTLVLGGFPNSNAFTAELGTRTMLVGVQDSNGGGLLVHRTAGNVLFRTGLSGDTGEGGTLRWGADTGAGDTFLFRAAAAFLRTTGTFQADTAVKSTGKGLFTGGLGVGNSAAASVAVGTLVKKIQVFDESGSSLGYIPVYSSIT